MDVRKRLLKMCAGALFALVALAAPFVVTGEAQASFTRDFSGTITYDNDVALYTFTVSSLHTDVKIWTDSYNWDWNGAEQHFDPIIALWDASGNLLGQNDDTPNQTHDPYLDANSYLEFASLLAGRYTISITSAGNLAWGTLLSEGFKFDFDDPINIRELGGDGTYHVNYSANAVPIPGTVLLLGPALLGLFGIRNKLQG